MTPPPETSTIYPATFPHDLEKKPRLLGESLVYAAVQAALPSSWSVFYDWPVTGTRRRVDFLCIDPGRGIAAFEVKGGLVHKRRASFVQQVRRDGMRKTILPFGQLKLAVSEVLKCCGVAAVALPLHASIFFPHMSQAAYTFPEGPHMFTREHLVPPRLWAKLAPSLPVTGNAETAAEMHRLIAALARR